MPRIPAATRKRLLLDRHASRWDSCVACPLGAKATNHVLYKGTVPCDILFIGEAPGEREDVLGVPFIGPAGQVLDRILQKTMDLLARETASRKPPSDPYVFTWAVTNTLCCRPPDNRNPFPQEIEACSPRLQEFLSLAEPQHLILLGKVAEEYAVRTYISIVRRTPTVPVQTYTIAPDVTCWYHPAYLLRKGRAFQDQLTSDYAIQLAEIVKNLVPF